MIRVPNFRIALKREHAFEGLQRISWNDIISQQAFTYKTFHFRNHALVFPPRMSSTVVLPDKSTSPVLSQR